MSLGPWLVDGTVGASASRKVCYLVTHVCHHALCGVRSSAELEASS